MAQPKQNLRERKRELVLSLDGSRLRLVEGSADLRKRLSPIHIASSYLRRHPLQIFGATSIGVALLTWLLIPRGRARDQKLPKSPSRRLAGWIIVLLKGSIRNWLFTRVMDYLRTKQSETDSLLGP